MFDNLPFKEEMKIWDLIVLIHISLITNEDENFS